MHTDSSDTRSCCQLPQDAREALPGSMLLNPKELPSSELTEEYQIDGFLCRALYKGSLFGDVAFVKTILNRFSPSAEVMRGPIIRAAGCGHVRCVQHLLEHFSSTEQELDELLIDIALTAMKQNIMELLTLTIEHLSVSGVDGFSRWVLPAAVHNDTMFRYLLSCQIRPASAWSAALPNEAATRGTPEIFKLCLEFGADGRAPGVRPLHAAAGAPFTGRIAMLAFLVQEQHYYSHINLLNEATLEHLVRSSVCGTPLHLAMANGFFKRARWLMDMGSDCDLKNQFGETPRDLYDLWSKQVTS